MRDTIEKNEGVFSLNYADVRVIIAQDAGDFEITLKKTKHDIYRRRA